LDIYNVTSRRCFFNEDIGSDHASIGSIENIQNLQSKWKQTKVNRFPDHVKKLDSQCPRGSNLPT